MQARLAQVSTAWHPRRTSWLSLVRPVRAATLVEIGLSLSGAGLGLFMVMHLALLFTILIGATAMDALAEFLEGYYLLQAAVPFLVLLLAAHVLLSVRKTPATFAQQWTFMRHLRSVRHFDTWTWLFQIVSGIALLALIAIHLWVVLTDLPIQAAKSGTRVFEIYIWLYVPFVLLVESHLSFGIYRIAVKWGLLSRRWAHPLLLVWTAGVLSLGFAILVAFYRLGGEV